MRAGAARGLITIQREIQMGVTAQNAPKMVWQSWRADVPVEIVTMRGKEHFDFQTKQRFSEEVYRFVARRENVEGIDASMRILGAQGAVYNIKALLPDEQRRSDVVIECTRQDAVVGPAALMAYLLVAPPSGVAGEAYGGFTISAKGGTAPYAFSISAGALPDGLALDANTGAVTGTPSGAGNSDITFTVTDADGAVADLPEVTIEIATG